MDRGLNPAYICGGTRPTHARLTRFLFVTTHFRGTLPQIKLLPSEAPSQIPRCNTATPSASIWLGLGLPLTSIIERYRLPLRRVPCQAHNKANSLGQSKALLRSVLSTDLQRSVSGLI